MGFLDKLTDKVNSSSSSSSRSSAQFPQAPAAPPLGPDSVFRYRKQRGINLGAWFVLERWIVDAPYRNAVKPGQSDWDVAKGKDAKRILEEHWDGWVRDEDWAWIKERGFNSVRLPVSQSAWMNGYIASQGSDHALTADWVLSLMRGHPGCA